MVNGHVLGSYVTYILHTVRVRKLRLSCPLLLKGKSKCVPPYLCVLIFIGGLIFSDKVKEKRDPE